MSNHHTQKWQNLHHKQVKEGRERRTMRQADRLASFLCQRAMIRADFAVWQMAVLVFSAIMVLGWIGIAYVNLWWLLR